MEGGIPAAAQHYESEASPELLIIETRESPEAIFEQLERLSGVCRAETDLILLGPHNDVLLYRRLTKQGVREYIPMPADPRLLLDAVVAVCADPEEVKQGRLISFIGASGGAGSTVMANNIAWGLGKLYGGEVILIDLDLAFGTVALDFNLESQQNSAQSLAQAERLDEQMLERFFAKYSDNLALLTAPGDCNTAADIDVTALDRLLKILRSNASWVVADLPHYWGGWVRHVLDASSDIVLTAVPTLASLGNAKNAADTLNARRKNDTPVRVVLNRVGANPKTDITLKDFANTLGGEPAAVVPHDPALFSLAANAGHMIGEAPKNQRVLEPLNKLAALVSGRQGTEKAAQAKKGGGLFQRLRAKSK